MNWRRIACARLVRGPVLILLTVGLYTVLAVYVFGLEIYKLAFTPTYKDDMLQQNPYALPHCGNRQISPDLRLLRQLQWVHPQAMSYPRVEPEPGKASEEMLPLIFYDKRLAYHPTFMEGCEFRCRFTSNLTQLNRSQLVVFTSNPSPDERLYAGDIPWAFESAEPLHRMPWLSEEVKKRFSMFITYHPYASIPYYYGVYRAFLNPECVMSEAQRKRLRAQNSLHLLPVHHFRKTKKGCLGGLRQRTFQ
uniref:Glycoprotein 3-alpha-L-fucosyltransferase A n=1 Tax=Schistocephalus solidus TaxID=70667 RepID=A0A0X3PCK6_SCHSO